ncbi:unnamed protein product [Pleuronectes platessa]|uniref:Uncharacterized protein n=1 Tax=Pleuronectes platessa TaxID=8262 RepID=A0A9N7VBJ1_PLEPL|nr:unnamed protein product [Pleuronectes platessa]
MLQAYFGMVDRVTRPVSARHRCAQGADESEADLMLFRLTAPGARVSVYPVNGPLLRFSLSVTTESIGSPRSTPALGGLHTGQSAPPAVSMIDRRLIELGVCGAL